MPGVLLIEGMAQTAGAICVSRADQRRPAAARLFHDDRRSRFRKPVLPGDRVEFHMRKLNQKRSMWWFEGKAKVDGALVCEAEIGASLAAGKAAP